MTDNNLLHSIIIPVGSRVDDLRELVEAYATALGEAGVDFEIIVVLDGWKEALLAQLRELATTRDWIRVIQFSREFGESAALMAGFSESRGDVLVTLPAYWQVAASELPRLLRSFDSDTDMLIAVRWPRKGSAFEKLRRRMFHGLLEWITGHSYRDLGCGVRMFRKDVAQEIPLYGDQYRFFPVLALRRGFRVREVELAQSPLDQFRGRYRIREYVHGILNVMTVFFLVRFTKKPLRFFGSVGFIAAGIGGIIVLTLVIQRLFFDVALADRPALLLASLLVVLGVQLFGLGLLGELVIFSHAGESREYAIRSITYSRSEQEASPTDAVAEDRASEGHYVRENSLS
jgi:glycosyltransferase involved in cell wall biosynthesis